MGKYPILKKVMALAVLIWAFGSGSICYAAENSQGIHVNYHTQSEIRNYLKKQNVDLDAKTTYGTTPSAIAPYKAGTVSDKSLKSALGTFNAVRYIAGIDANVTLNTQYNQKAQAAALVNAVNGGLSHYPTKPSGMSSTLYSLGYSGAGSSNLAYTSWNTGLGYSIVNLWMNDGDASNIDRVGHRRWVLNPSLQETGFGMATGATGGRYTAMYAFDNVWGQTDYYGVAWPAQNMPVEYFGNTYPWSISMGTQVDETKVKVTLTRKNDNKKWTFSNSNSDGYFSVNNDGYGRTGCIIFRPSAIRYAVGNQFNVTITGLSQKVSYDVNFFSADIDESACSHSYGTAQVTKKATLTANGQKKSTCTKCGHTKTTTIYKASAISLTKKSVVCNNQTQKPKVTVKTNKGKTIASKNYTVSYTGTPKKPGVYRVTVKMKGEYSGKKTLNYTIKPKTVQLTSVKPLKKAIKVTSKTGWGITGYQISYSTDKNFSQGKTKTTNIKGTDKTQNTIKKLKSKTTYYVRIRTYKTATTGGKQTNIYSSWSKSQKVKTR